jgi:hypothetical protein
MNGLITSWTGVLDQGQAITIITVQYSQPQDLQDQRYCYYKWPRAGSSGYVFHLYRYLCALNTEQLKQ